MLGATQSQLFNTQEVGGTQRQIGTDEAGSPIYETTPGRTEITGFKPYKPYSQNVSDYVAGFSPMQQQAFGGMQSMRPSAQLGTATDMAGIAGLGSLGAGAQFARQATDPYAVQSYMSPYMQNVVDYQKQAAVRDYGIAMPRLQAQAVGQGAFGGNRMALQQAEAQRGLMSQLQGIQATGTQKAFEDAQRQQQFGAQLGLQGYGQALGAAGQLGQLGQTQYGQQMGILEGLNKFGGQQQQLEQQKINQAIQDYATQQQYPMLQLGFMSNMLRGLPMQAQTTQMYQAQPTALQQGIGTVGALGSLYGAGALGKKEGGHIKAYREGGITQAYAPGGRVNPNSQAVGDIQSQLASMDIDELKRVAATTQSQEIRRMASELIAQKQIAAQAEQQNQNARMSGIAMAGGPAFENQGMAGGGIVAFNGEEESLVRQGIDPETGEPYKSVDPIARFGQYMNPFSGKGSLGSIARGGKSIEETYKEGNFAFKPASEADRKRQAQAEADDKQEGPGVAKETTAGTKGTTGEKGETGTKGEGTRSVVQTGPANVNEYLKQIRGMGPQGRLGEDTQKYINERLGLSDDRLKRAQNLAALQGFVEFGTKAAPGGIGQAALSGFGKYGEGYGKAFEAEDKIKTETIKMGQELDAARRAEERGDVKLASELFDKAADRDNRIKAAQIGAAATGQAGRFEQEAVQRVMAENPKMTFAEALQTVRGAGKFESTEVQRAKVGLENIVKRLGVMSKKDPERPALEKQYQDLMRYLTPGGGIGGGQGGGGNLVQNKDGSFNYVPR
jgi:hypothetical protein